MKILIKILIILVLFIGLEKLIRTQTHAFRVEKTTSEYPFNPDWEVAQSEPPAKLRQSFYFLGSGVQCYAFIGEDQETVLKVFKHYHMWPSTPLLRKLPLPNWASNWRNNTINKREKRMRTIFSSAVLAHSSLSDKTGVFYLNINSTQDYYPTIILYDNIGIAHRLDLNHTPFALQKRAVPIYSYLEKHPLETKIIIDSFFSCISKLAELKIVSGDTHIGRNFGVCGSEVIEIDIGSFFKKEGETCDIQELKTWIKKNRPEYEEYIQQKCL